MGAVGAAPDGFHAVGAVGVVVAVGAAPDGFDAVGVVVAVGSAAGLTDTADLDAPIPMSDERCRHEVWENVSKGGES